MEGLIVPVCECESERAGGGGRQSSLQAEEAVEIIEAGRRFHPPRSTPLFDTGVAGEIHPFDEVSDVQVAADDEPAETELELESADTVDTGLEPSRGERSGGGGSDVRSRGPGAPFGRRACWSRTACALALALASIFNTALSRSGTCTCFSVPCKTSSLSRFASLNPSGSPRRRVSSALSSSYSSSRALTSSSARIIESVDW